jgi:hypothetical protein
MPLMLRREEQDLILELSAPLGQRRTEFISALAQELETVPEIGPGNLHRAARRIISDFWSAPPDLRAGRLGPRGPRS